MKNTGIVRRVDDLGRVVIPKEIRRDMHIRVGDLFQFFLDGDALVFKKCNETVAKEEVAKSWMNAWAWAYKDYSPVFTIENKVVTCECIRDNVRLRGEARCSDEDEFSPVVGMVYAFSRAANIPLPIELK